MQPSDLIAAAERILASPESVELIPVITEYTEAFEQWYVEWEKRPDKSKLPASDPIFTLQKKHEAVLNLAQALKGIVSDDLKRLKRKGKGIIAYADALPGADGRSAGRVRPRKL